MARDLVNEPAKHSSPSDLVEVAKQIADKSQGVISVEIFNREQCAEKKMGAFLAVAQGQPMNRFSYTYRINQKN